MGSIWSEFDSGRQPYPTLDGDEDTEVLIIGGGMAGILAAHRLREAGVDCVVAEAKTVGGGVTENTTAKLTAQHALIYADLLDRFGAERARLYYDANTRAIDRFRELHARFPCDFEEKTAYVYTVRDRGLIEREAEAYDRLRLPGRFEENLPLPYRTLGALGMERQAQFHPLKLLYALAEKLHVHENTFIHRIEDGVAHGDGGRIRARHIILATHYPLVNIPGLYFMKLYQHRSYVLALEGVPLVEGMYIDEREDGHSFRTYKDLLLLGGGSHRTGKPGGGYEELRALAHRAYPGAAERARWATQDCMTLDAVPYAGRHRAGTPGLYVATGFNKWGMTGSMAAAELLSDLIVRGESELEELYSPGRSMPAGPLLSNIGAAAVGLLSPGGPRCAHMGCKLHKNDAEGTWDCACHGSRFDETGHLIDNPAKRGISLQKGQ